jgi:hypothetical protein
VETEDAADADGEEEVEGDEEVDVEPCHVLVPRTVVLVGYLRVRLRWICWILWQVRGNLRRVSWISRLVSGKGNHGKTGHVCGESPQTRICWKGIEGNRGGSARFGRIRCGKGACRSRRRLPQETVRTLSQEVAEESCGCSRRLLLLRRLLLHGPASC